MPVQGLQVRLGFKSHSDWTYCSVLELTGEMGASVSVRGKNNKATPTAFFVFLGSLDLTSARKHSQVLSGNPTVSSKNVSKGILSHIKTSALSNSYVLLTTYFIC